MQMALQQRALKKSYPNFKVNNILIACQPTIAPLHIKQNDYLIGSNNVHSYDNEQPQHRQFLQSFTISINPVSNAEFLAFMQGGIYQDKTFWSDDGWQWLNEHTNNKATMSPEHWQQDTSGHWFGINATGAHELQATETVYGINYFEACAYAKWCNARLPHEHEWEVAKTTNLLKNTGHAWEWCDNLFYAYPNFKPFPYDGYSLPSFEQAHFVLKGGSPHTQPNIKRPSFRNFFGPDKRHVFAGLRLVYP